MSKRHQATRRRSYGRRQHDLHQREDVGRLGPWRGGDDEGFESYGRFAPAVSPDRGHTVDHLAAWSAGDRD